jgi:hypothetical protein
MGAFTWANRRSLHYAALRISCYAALAMATWEFIDATALDRKSGAEWRDLRSA